MEHRRKAAGRLKQESIHPRNDYQLERFLIQFSIVRPQGVCEPMGWVGYWWSQLKGRAFVGLVTKRWIRHVAGMAITRSIHCKAIG